MMWLPPDQMPLLSPICVQDTNSVTKDMSHVLSFLQVAVGKKPLLSVDTGPAYHKKLRGLYRDAQVLRKDMCH